MFLIRLPRQLKFRMKITTDLSSLKIFSSEVRILQYLVHSVSLFRLQSTERFLIRLLYWIGTLKRRFLCRRRPRILRSLMTKEIPLHPRDQSSPPGGTWHGLIQWFCRFNVTAFSRVWGYFFHWSFSAGFFCLCVVLSALQILSSVSREATLFVAIVGRIRLSCYHAQF